MAEVIVSVRDLQTHYGTTKVLDGVSFDVHRGEIFVLIGGSGSGKSTLLKHMCGLLTPTAGQILFQGKDLARMDEDHMSEMQRNIGIAFQASGLFNSMTTGDNVAMPLREHTDYDAATIDALVRMKLGLVGLAHAKDKMPSELSGGMKKRAGLARAIALDPPLLYFDEPSAGLDPIMASGLDNLILNLRDLLGITIIIVTHELESIRTIADRLLMLDQGKAIFIGTVDEAEKNGPPRVKQFFAREPDDYIRQRAAV